MRIHFFLKIVLFFLSLLLVQTGTAQVTIGLTEKPVDGSLLQLKNKLGITGANGNASKGLALPRVELTALNILIIGGVDYNAEALKHTGLTVFNVKIDPSNGLSKAPYVWDGAKWNALYTKNVIIAPASLYFYKSAWKPKKLPVRGIMDNSDLNVDIAIEPKAGGTVDFNGIGAIFPASPHLQTDGEEEYTFQPVENASGQELSTDVTFTASRGGDARSVNKTTRIIHYPYEFPIHIEPSILPATLINGVGAVSIWSAADWKISASQPVDHDPLGMLATNLTLGEELRNETPLKLHINQNPTWDEKELKINVESVGASGKHYEDLAPHTLIVKQEGNEPSIEIIEPANEILDFGLQTTGSKTVTISSNARWIAMGAFDIANVVDPATPELSGAEYGVDSPADPVDTTFDLPMTTNTTVKAGVYRSKITFTTANHDPASANSNELVVERTVPLVFDTFSLSGTAFNPDGGTVYVYVGKTNTNWLARLAGTSTIGSQTVTSLTTNSSLSLTVPPNAGGSQAAYTVQVSVDNFNWYDVGNITVDPRTLSISAISPDTRNFLSFDGCLIRFNVTANYAGAGKIYINNGLLGSFDIQIVNGATTVNTCTIGANGNSNRNFEFSYINPSGISQHIATYTQYRRLATNTLYGYFLSISDISDLGATIINPGAGYAVNANTDCIPPSVWFSCVSFWNDFISWWSYKYTRWNSTTGVISETIGETSCGDFITKPTPVYHVPWSVLKTQ